MGSENVTLYAQWTAVPPYAHTIAIDGVNDFTLIDESFGTTTAAYTSYYSWNDTYLYFGLDGAAVDYNSADYRLLIYVDGVAGFSTTTGRNYNTQQPTLAFGAGYLLDWGTDSSTMDAYEYDGANWTSAVWGLSADDISRSGTYVEGRIDLGNIGDPTTFRIHMGMVSTGGGSEWTFAGTPSESFTDGYNPGYSSYYWFDRLAAASPNSYSAQ